MGSTSYFIHGKPPHAQNGEGILNQRLEYSLGKDVHIGAMNKPMNRNSLMSSDLS